MLFRHHKQPPEALFPGIEARRSPPLRPHERKAKNARILHAGKQKTGARRARYVREVRPSVPLNGSDDATLMIRRVQSQGGRAGYFLVGAGLEASHEHAAVDFDERYLVTLYDIFANLVIGLSGNW